MMTLIRIFLMGVPLIIVAALSMVVVWFATGCAPLTYNTSEAGNTKTQHSVNIINTLRRNGCVPVAYAEKLSEFEDNRKVGCNVGR